MSTQQTESPLLTRRELADRWRCDVDTIAKREREGVIRPVKVAHKRLYRLSEIQQIEATP